MKWCLCVVFWLPALQTPFQQVWAFWFLASFEEDLWSKWMYKSSEEQEKHFVVSKRLWPNGCFLKGQSHGYFPIFHLLQFWLIYIKVPRGQYWMSFQNKKKPELVFGDFIWDTMVETWKILPEVFKSDAISILTIPIQTYLLQFPCTGIPIWILLDHYL